MTDALSGSGSQLDALVVGAGPVGLTMASELLRYGLTCRIVDRAPRPTDQSRALVVWPRTLECLDRMGCAADFVREGIPAEGARLHVGGRIVMEARIEPPDTAFPEPRFIPQSETERLLLEHLQRLGGRVERAVEAVEVHAKGDSVTTNLRHEDGRTESVRSAWLLGCDGAHSIVRKQLGIEFTGEFEPNDWVLADLHLAGPISSNHVNLYWHARGILAIFPVGRDRFRVVADLGKAAGKAHPPTPTLEQVQSLLNDRGASELRASDPIWLSGFRIHERKVSDYRKGRCFLAGDAAHIHSPAGGQGMNTGMQDAFNLAWKLALVHRGQAPASLLDSYSVEREAVGEMVLRNAGRMTRVAILRNPIGQFLRNTAIGILGKIPAVRRGFTYELTELGIAYPKSPLNGEDPGPGWNDGLRPGGRLPDLLIPDPGAGRPPVRLYSRLDGKRWDVLLLSAVPNGQLAAIAESIGSTHSETVRVQVLDPAPGELWRRIGARAETAALAIRPDGYLAYRGQPALAEDVLRYLSRVLSR